MQPFLSINPKTGLLRVEVKGRMVAEIRDIPQFTEFQSKRGYEAYWSSSSLDYPEQYTSNHDVIRLAKHIRSHAVKRFSES